MDTIAKEEEEGKLIPFLEKEDMDALNALQQESIDLQSSREETKKEKVLFCCNLDIRKLCSTSKIREDAHVSKEELELFLKNRFQYTLSDTENESRGRRGSKKDADYFDCFGCGKPIVLANYPAHSLTCFNKVLLSIIMPCLCLHRCR